MKKLITVILMVLFINTAKAQYDWENISYTHSSVSASDNSKKYYIINIGNSGKSRIEYFSDGKVNVKDFNISKKNLNYINSKLKKSGIFKVNPKDLSSGIQQNADNIFTMTLTLDREFGEKYEYKFDRSKLPPKRGENNEDAEKEEEEKGEKLQVIPVPNNLKEEYKKQFYNLYFDIEMIVPDRIWNEAEEVLNK